MKIKKKCKKLEKPYKFNLKKKKKNEIAQMAIIKNQQLLIHKILQKK